MIQTGQEKYNEISEKLISVKKINSISTIKEGLFFCINKLKNLIKESSNYQDYTAFTFDKNILFKTNRNETTTEGPDRTIISEGLLTELLNQVNINSAEELSNELQDYLFEIHAKLSQRGEDIEQDKKEVLELLEKILVMLE